MSLYNHTKLTQLTFYGIFKKKKKRQRRIAAYTDVKYKYWSFNEPVFDLIAHGIQRMSLLHQRRDKVSL